jgi:hypothetical protein
VIDWSYPDDEELGVDWMRRWLARPHGPFDDAVQLTYGITAA